MEDAVNHHANARNLSLNYAQELNLTGELLQKLSSEKSDETNSMLASFKGRIFLHLDPAKNTFNYLSDAIHVMRQFVPNAYEIVVVSSDVKWLKYKFYREKAVLQGFYKHGGVPSEYDGNKRNRIGVRIETEHGFLPDNVMDVNTAVVSLNDFENLGEK